MHTETTFRVLPETKVTLLKDWPESLDGEWAPLLNEGYKVVAFKGMDDLAHETELPDLYIIDLRRMGQDAFEVVRKIREMSSRVGILMIISAKFQDLRVQALLSGADNYILRPYENEELFAIVTSISRRLWRGLNA